MFLWENLNLHVYGSDMKPCRALFYIHAVIKGALYSILGRDLVGLIVAV